MLKFLLFVSVIMILPEDCKSARILGIFPAPVISHQLVFKALTQELAKRGHQVTVITSFSVSKDQKINNYTEIDLSYIGVKMRELLLAKNLNKTTDMFSQFEMTINVAFNMVNTMLQTREVQNLIKYNSFDLVLIEDCTKSALIFSHLINAPVILISSFGGSFETFEIVGGVIHPVLYPLAIRKRFQNLSMWDKISILHTHYRLHNIHKSLEITQNQLNAKLYGPDTPTLNDLKKNVQMVFLNIHSVWDSNRPVPPNVIYLGGLHQNSRKGLPKDLKLSLDSSVNGVIYMSFGTTVDSSIFSEKIVQIFIKVFSQLPYDIYWKWNSEKIPGLPKNVKIANWFPQSDLLRHPKIKLFITQGGLQSTDEAITAGVPLIGLPIFWDQWLNVDKYVQLKIGIQLDIETLTDDALSNAINTAIDDKEYRKNIIKLRSLILDSPQSSLDRAVWWTEYVIRRGAEHLGAPSANMSWTDYYEVEIILYLLSFTIVTLTVLYIALKRMLNFIIIKFNFNKTKTH